MSSVGTILAGIAVAIGGVMLGRKIENIKTALEKDGDDPKRTKGNKKEKIIEAEKDPETGVFQHKK